MLTKLVFCNNCFSDIRPVINHYKDETSQELEQAAEEASKFDFDKFEQRKAISGAYLTIRKCSVKEAVYQAMPELWLRKTFPGVDF